MRLAMSAVRLYATKVKPLYIKGYVVQTKGSREIGDLHVVESIKGDKVKTACHLESSDTNYKLYETYQPRGSISEVTCRICKAEVENRCSKKHIRENTKVYVLQRTIHTENTLVFSNIAKANKAVKQIYDAIADSKLPYKLEDVYPGLYVWKKKLSYTPANGTSELCEFLSLNALPLE